MLIKNVMVEILIADDEPNQIELMKFNLEKKGFSVKLAYNGEQDGNPSIHG